MIGLAVAVKAIVPSLNALAILRAMSGAEDGAIFINSSTFCPGAMPRSLSASPLAISTCWSAKFLAVASEALASSSRFAASSPALARTWLYSSSALLSALVAASAFLDAMAHCSKDDMVPSALALNSAAPSEASNMAPARFTTESALVCSSSPVLASAAMPSCVSFMEAFRATRSSRRLSAPALNPSEVTPATGPMTGSDAPSCACLAVRSANAIFLTRSPRSLTLRISASSWSAILWATSNSAACALLTASRLADTAARCAPGFSLSKVKPLSLSSP